MIMILSPTRELAQQIAVEAKSLCTFHKFAVVTLVGKIASCMQWWDRHSDIWLFLYLLCYFMLCHVTLCYVCYVMSCHVMSCHVMFVMSCHVMSCLFYEFLLWGSDISYVRGTGGTNIESDKRALNRENLDIIVGTPGTTRAHLLYMCLCWYVHACRHTCF
jgi:hypothetical protein